MAYFYKLLIAIEKRHYRGDNVSIVKRQWQQWQSPKATIVDDGGKVRQWR